MRRGAPDRIPRRPRPVSQQAADTARPGANLPGVKSNSWWVLSVGAFLLPGVGAQDVDRSRGAIPQKPPLVRWQRTLADAEAVAKATGKPLLLCVNMNFEPASERMAHDRYTSEAFAKLTEGFVSVLASPDRHTPRDHDELGRRIPCPRFGCMTCGEHIAVEPEMFEKYLKSNRVAPRHTGVASDGSILFDIFLTNELGRIDAALREHGKEGTGGTSPRSSAAREAEEAAYLAADHGGRTRTLQAAARADHEPYGLLRLGLADPDPGLRELARKALAATATKAAQPLVLQMLDDEPDRDARKVLVPVLAKLADDKPETKLALRVHEAMLSDPEVLPTQKWLAALQSASPEPATDPDEDLDARIEELSQKASRSDAKAATLVELGTVTMRFARARMAEGSDPQFLFLDVKSAAERALAKDGKNPQAHALRAEIAQLLGEREVAAEHARRALPALLAAGEVASARAAGVLAALAEGAARAIYDAEGKKVEWKGELLAEADAAYRVLEAHPLGTPAHALAHADLLAFLGLRGCARHAIETALRRHPADATLHERLRALVTQAHGVEALTSAYERLGADAPDRASHEWFAGFAEFVVAEHHKRQGDDANAYAAYERSVEAFLASERTNPGYAQSASWYAAMGRVGQARVRLDQGQLAAAAKLVAEGLKRMPAIAEREDGLGRTPLFTLKQILEKLSGEDMAPIRAELEQQLGQTLPDVWAKAVGQ